MASAKKVKYVLVNESARLIHVPCGENLTELKPLIPGRTLDIEVTDAELNTFKNVTGLKYFTEEGYAEYINAKRILNESNGVVESQNDSKTENAGENKTQPTGWVKA